MLYNLINSALSPINGDIDLCIEKVSFFNNLLNPSSNSLSKKTEIENSDKNENENNNEKEIRTFNLNDLLLIRGKMIIIIIKKKKKNKKKKKEKKKSLIVQN